MRVLVCLLIVGSVMLMSCSAELEVDSSLNNFVCLLPGLYIQAQQLDGDLPHDGAEEVGVPAEENFGLLGRFFRTLSTFTPGF